MEAWEIYMTSWLALLAVAVFSGVLQSRGFSKHPLDTAGGLITAFMLFIGTPVWLVLLFAIWPEQPWAVPA